MNQLVESLMLYIQSNKNRQTLLQCKKSIGLHIDQLSELALHAHYYHKLYIPSMNFQGGQYGNAILPKYNFDTVVVVPLHGQNRGEPQSIGIVSFKISKLYRQMRLDKQPFILAGDFNDEPNSRTVQLLLTE